MNYVPDYRLFIGSAFKLNSWIRRSIWRFCYHTAIYKDCAVRKDLVELRSSNPFLQHNPCRKKKRAPITSSAIEGALASFLHLEWVFMPTLHQMAEDMKIWSSPKGKTQKGYFMESEKQVLSNDADKETLTWLHLSDLHYCEPETGWDAVIPS